MPGFLEKPRKSATVLGDFSRTVRDEPLYYIYNIKVFLLKERVPVDEVVTWLQERYSSSSEGNRYRVMPYHHTDGTKYVDYILMEAADDHDLMFIRLRWGWSKSPVVRSGKKKHTRLNSEQRAELNALIDQVTSEFYARL